MKGQWKGKFDGTSSGSLVLDLDERATSFEGVAFLVEDNSELPNYLVEIEAPKGQQIFNTKNRVMPVFRGEVLDPKRFSELFPGVQLSSHADTNWNVDGRVVKVEWKTGAGTSGTANLMLNDGDRQSKREPETVSDWKQFRDYAAKLELGRYIFRGQENSEWRLRTSFHRTGRSNSFRFANVDVPTLYKNLSHLTQHVFDLEKPDQNGAFISLVQHHGYPTPLLDWTHSPFIAAYFAFNDLSAQNLGENNKIRIHMFDKQAWINDFPQQTNLRMHTPHFSILETLAIGNPRMVPQQALASVTNVADIETYILECELLRSKMYLKVIDLPASTKTEAVKELRMMGITAGSLFPGIDGTCKQLREQMFD